MNEAGDRRAFFVHVMKTGGATFRRHIDHNFPAPGAVYPHPSADDDIQHANFLVDRLVHLPEARREQVRVYAGHYPYVATRLLHEDLFTLTMLRDPVDRTLSYLKQRKRLHPEHRDLELEEIYEDPWVFPMLIRDHQVKIFAMTETDKLESYLDVIDVDDARLATAIEHLEAVDLVGLQERHDEFLDDVRGRLGWEIRERSSWRVSEERRPVPDAFRRRIAADNQADVAFYEHARALVARRAGRAA